MRSLAVGVVQKSEHPAVAVGEYLYGWFGWQDFCVATDKEILRRVNPKGPPLTTALGVLGINGLTAYIALMRVGSLNPGETVVVSLFPRQREPWAASWGRLHVGCIATWWA